MKNKILLLFLVSFSTNLGAQVIKSKKEINSVLDAWHKAAGEADFDTYFGLMTNDGVFIGTDAMENWQNQAFKEFSKPYFDRGQSLEFYSC